MGISSPRAPRGITQLDRTDRERRWRDDSRSGGGGESSTLFRPTGKISRGPKTVGNMDRGPKSAQERLQDRIDQRKRASRSRENRIDKGSGRRRRMWRGPKDSWRTDAAESREKKSTEGRKGRNEDTRRQKNLIHRGRETKDGAPKGRLAEPGNESEGGHQRLGEPLYRKPTARPARQPVMGPIGAGGERKRQWVARADEEKNGHTVRPVEGG